jgi:hypothetical protein
MPLVTDQLPPLLRWARTASSTVSLVALVAVNLLPLIGVLFWGWSLMLILVLYWLESGIVGFINIFKIALARGGADTPPVRFDEAGNVTVNLGGLTTVSSNLAPGCLVPFFVLHYGIFWVVHGTFIFLLPLFAGLGTMRMGPGGGIGFATMDFGALPFDALALGAVGMAISHGASFFLNYLGRREYLRVSPGQQMFSVYGRVVALHLTIVLGASLIAVLGTPVEALAILVAVKIVIDVALHLREHARAAPAAPAAPGVTDDAPGAPAVA